jgi:hypothetical protein
VNLSIETMIVEAKSLKPDFDSEQERGTVSESASNPEEALRSVLESNTFRKAPTLRNLLFYLAGSREGSVSEYAIATEVLGRKHDFDPKFDATVRVQISRLRAKLKQYYETEAPQAEWRVELPMGEHRLQFRQVNVVQETHVDSTGSLKTGAAWRDWRLMLVSLLAVLLLLSSIWLLLVNRRLQAEMRREPASPQFWQAFFAGGKPARIVFPTPVFYQWRGRSLRVRDYRVNEFGDHAKSTDLAEMIRRWGPPTLSQSYSVTSDTKGAIRLTQYLSVMGFQVSVGGPGELSLEQFGDHNIIFLGIPATNSHIDGYLQQTNFRFLPGSDSVIVNRQPLAGEPDQFHAVDQSDRRRIRPGMIALLPGKVEGTKLLVLAGDTASLVSCLIAEPSFDLLEAKWRSHQAPPYFEVVLMPETEGDTLLKVQPVAFRAFQPLTR